MVALAAILSIAFASVLAFLSAVGTRQSSIEREIDALESECAKERTP